MHVPFERHGPLIKLKHAGVYNDRAGRWYLNRNDGTWVSSSTQKLVLNLVETKMREKYQAVAANVPTADGPRHRHALQSCNIISCKKTAEVLANRANVRIASLDFEENPFDADPKYLGSINAIIDLIAGKQVQPSKDILVSKRAPFSYDPQATCERWLKQLELTQPDEAIRSFLQEYSGVCLSGFQLEPSILFNYGEGANGKSTFVYTLDGLLGKEYAWPIKKALVYHLPKFEEQAGENDIVDLEGRRLLTCVESQQRAFNEEFLKEYTGGDRMRGRQKYGLARAFQPMGKFMICGNTKPTTLSIDEAIVRRLVFLNWPIIIPKEKRQDQRDLLKLEFPGIFNWALAGFQRIVARGMKIAIPEKLKASTAEYFSEQDLIKRFFEEAIEKAAAEHVYQLEAFESFCRWYKDQDRVDDPKFLKREFFKRMRDRFGEASFRKLYAGKNALLGHRLKKEYLALQGEMKMDVGEM
jgi:P4 family phage/plasmid primase-like protien